jgi:hypothetical protein
LASLQQGETQQEARQSRHGPMMAASAGWFKRAFQRNAARSEPSSLLEWVDQPCKGIPVMHRAAIRHAMLALGAWHFPPDILIF